MDRTELAIKKIMQLYDVDYPIEDYSTQNFVEFTFSSNGNVKSVRVYNDGTILERHEIL